MMINKKLSLLDKLKCKPYYLLILALCLTGLSYINTLNSPLVLDDRNSFIDSSLVYLPDFSLASLDKLTTTRFGYSRLIPILSFALNHKFSHGDAGYYHLTNISIHLFCCIALYLFMTRLISYPVASKSLKVIAPKLIVIFTCGLWVLSPIQTNAVTYLVQRMTSLATLFYLLTLYFYMRGRQAHDSIAAQYINYTVAVLFTILAAMSKENVATLPLVVLLIEEIFVSPGSVTTFIKKINWKTWSVLFILFILISPILQTLFHQHIILGYRARNFTLVERLLTESRAIIWYITLLILPLPSRMNLDHDFPISQSLLTPATTIVSIAIIALLLFLSWKNKRTNPLISFGILWLLLNLLIESSVIPLELVFEHRLYLPSIGLFISAAIIIDKLAYFLKSRSEKQDYNAIFILLTIIIFSIYSLLTTYRNNDWRDEISIYRDCAEKSPNKARAQANYGLALSRAGKYSEAIPILERAIALGQPFYESYLSAGSNIVLSLIKQNKNEEAIKKAGQIFRGIKVETDVIGLSRFFHNLAFAYLTEKKYDLALQAIKSSLALRNQNESTQSINLAMSILSSAYDRPGTISNMQFANGASKDTAILLKTAELLLDTKNYTDAANTIDILQRASPVDTNVDTLKKRLYLEQEKNKKASASGDIHKHNIYNQDYRYRYSLNMADFIINYYHPLLPVAKNLINYASRENLYHTDPFITLYTVNYYKITNQAGIDWEQIESSLKENPDFLPLLHIAYEHYLAFGQNENALKAAEHILDIYPGYSSWQQLVSSIKTLRKILHSFGDPGEQSST